MRGASRRAGVMRVALTIVVAVLAVLAEPVSGATQSLKNLVTVTSRIAGSGSNSETDVVDEKITGNGAKTFYAGTTSGENPTVYTAQLNPWVQIDLGGTKTIGSIDIYGDRSSTSCNIAFIDPNPERADVDADCSAGNPARDPETDRDPSILGNTGIIAVGDTACTSESECILGVDPVDSTKTAGVVATVCAHLKKPTDVGFDGGGVNPEGKFTVDCSSATGQYIYIQLVGPQRYLWLGEVMAELSDASSCTAGTDYASAQGQYLDGSSCQSCPANSKGDGGTATTCTCADGYYATKSGGNVNTCTACPTGSSKTGSTIFGDSAEETTSVCVANCAENKYWDGDSCEDCPANSVGAGGTATTCTCAANYWAQKSGSTWSCELCSGGRTKAAGSTVLSGDKSEVEDTVCVDATSCDANHYLSGGECVACPDDSTSTEAASTACRCPDNEYAEWSNGGGGSWSCESCPDGTVKSGGSLIPQASEASDSCNADCASNKYWDGSACQSCPADSVGDGGTATTCTCAANYWAQKSGSTWSCESCSGQRTKDATSTVPGSGSSEDDDDVCVDATSCTDNHYLSGGECVACADGSTSTDATSTTCECGAAQYFADGSCNACPSTSTCASPPCSAVTECECPADHYVEWKSNNWVCTECKSGQTKTATAIPADKSSEETASACSAATTCANDDNYLATDDDTSLKYCETCPVGSTSADATSTTCTCGANMYAKKDECSGCSAGTFRTGAGAVVPGADETKGEVCLAQSCSENQYLKDGTCTDCAAGSTSAGGDVTTCVANCDANKYWDGDSCESCPANSVGAGGTAESCTCDEKFYAKLDGGTWSCASCPSDSTRSGSVVPQTESDACISSCASGKYWDGSACQTCPANSDGKGGAETSCTCANDYRAVVASGTWSCEECTGRQGSKIPQSSGASDECVASKACTTRQYFDSKKKSCQTCPDGSESEGGNADECTCGVNMYADKKGNSWKCVACTGGGTKAADSKVPGSGAAEKESDVCSAASSCDADYYLSDGKCEKCPANSIGSGGSATSCTCLDDYYAAYSSSKGGTYTCNKCDGKSGSLIPRSDDASDTCDNVGTGKTCSAKSMVPKNGLEVDNCPATVEDGSSCEVTCARGYSVGSPAVSTCDDGKVTLATCEAATCAENEYVLYGVCTACPAGSVNAAGDSASGDNTNCECPVATYRVVVDGVWSCVPCGGVLTRTAGDVVPYDENQPDANTQCGVDPSTCYAGCSGCTGTGKTDCNECSDGYTLYGAECVSDYPASTSNAVLDEYVEIGLAPRDSLTDAEKELVRVSMSEVAGIDVGSIELLHYPTSAGVAAGVADPTPPAYVKGGGKGKSNSNSRRRLLAAHHGGGGGRRRLLAHGNTHALVVVARFTVKKAQLDETSNIIGGGFGTGALLQTLRDKLGADFSAITLRSTATRLGKCTALDSDTGVCTTGEAVVFPARESDQLVEESANPCKSNNGGCDTLVRCKADPSMASGVMCGECPDGYTSSDYGVTCADADECAVNNGGCDPRVECINTVGGYKCGVCPDGFTKTKAGGCEDIDECARANGGCDKRTDCVNSAGGFSCGPCPAGYKGSGETKCVQESGCSVKNGGCDALTTCTDGGGGSTCGACPAGYEGDGETGCVDIDACAESPCYPGVHCKDLKPPAGADGFKCGKCPPGSTGDGIGAAGCAFNPCFIKNGGCDPQVKCTDADNDGVAECGACPSGTAADGDGKCVNVDSCSTDPCYAGALGKVLCTDLPPPKDGYKCGKCPKGSTGDGVGAGGCVAEDLCVTNNPCDPLTTCSNNGDTCSACPAGYKGSGKSGCKLISGCAVDNGGCDPASLCVDDGAGGSVCGACPSHAVTPHFPWVAGSTGTSGCIDIDGCADNPCFPGVECVDTPAVDAAALKEGVIVVTDDGTKDYTCGKCPDGYMYNGTNAGVGDAGCVICTMGVSIEATTVVNGEVLRGADTRIIAGRQLMNGACSNDAGYTFGWSASRSDGTDVTLDPKVTKSDTPQLYLPARSLPAGVSYTLKFTGRQGGNPLVSSTAEFNFLVSEAELEAIVKGGNAIVSEGVAVDLDGSSSIDPDEDPDYDWEYYWLCEDKTAADASASDTSCYLKDGSQLEISRDSQAKIAGLELKGAAGPSGRTYEFILEVKKGARRAEASTTVTVVSAAAGATGAPPSASIAPFTGNKVNAGEPARIKGTVASVADASTLKMSWSATRAQIDPAGADQAVDLAAAGFTSSVSLAAENLVLSPDVLTSGYRYKFRLDVEDGNGVAAAFIELEENTPPSDGTVGSVPLSGTALDTVFTMSAAAWVDDEEPLAYRFMARVKGDTRWTQLKDFSPVPEFVGTLPGGDADGKVEVAVEVKDSLGAVSAAKVIEVTSTWPVLADETALNAALSGGVNAAEDAIKNGDPEGALNSVAAASKLFDNFKESQRRRRLLGSNGCVGGGGVNATGNAKDRAAQRETMLNVTSSAGDAVPASSTFYATLAGTASAVLGDPCEATAAARSSGVNLVAGLIDATSNDLVVTGEGAENMLGALSAAVAPAEDGDANAASAQTAATAAARSLMTAQLGPALPGEKPANVTTSQMSYQAARVSTLGVGNSSTSSTSAAGSEFSVPGGALALGGSDPVDQLCLSLDYDPHAASASKGNASDPTDIRSAPKASPTVSLVLNNAASGSELAVRDLTVPIAFSMKLNNDGDDLRSPPCYVTKPTTNFTALENLETKSVGLPTCAFYDEDAGAASTKGCATLPNPVPPNAVVAWLPGVLDGSVSLANSAVDASFLWTFEHLPKAADRSVKNCECSCCKGGYCTKTEVGSYDAASASDCGASGCRSKFSDVCPASGKSGKVSAGYSSPSASNEDSVLYNCTLVEYAGEGGVRLRRYDGDGCQVQNPRNKAMCFWRRDTQTFEGCGCVLSSSVSCLCNHATDFSASSAPPKIKPISIDELLSVSLNDVLNTWKVFAVVFGMFACMSALACAFERRDGRARRAILDKFIKNEATTTQMGFTTVKDVWTWSIDVQEMQFMFSNLHCPNTRADLERVAGQQIGTDDAEAVDAKLLEIADMGKRDFAATDILRAIERRKAAMRRAKRAKEGLPQVHNGMEAADPTLVAEIEAKIEKEIEETHTGIDAWVDKETGKVRYGVVDVHTMNWDESFDSSDDDDDVPLKDRKSAKDEKQKKGLFGRMSSVVSPLERTLKQMPGKAFDAARKMPATLTSMPGKFQKDFRDMTQGKRRRRKEPELPAYFIGVPSRSEVKNMPMPERNGAFFCSTCGIRYVRFLIAFPIEALNRNLVIWKATNTNDSKHNIFLPFSRAVGTAMVYAYLDVKNIVGHVEMASRVYDAAQLPWMMPMGLTFPLLVAEFKAMMSGNLTSEGWMKRSNLWNIVALQNENGSWSATDSLAGALKATSPPTLSPPLPGTETPVVKSYYNADEILLRCPPELAACSSKLGWTVVDDMWCTIVAMEGCRQNGLSWVLNPWDDLYHEFDILQCGWTWVQAQVRGDTQVAKAVLVATERAAECVGAWRETFTATVQALHVQKKAEEAVKKSEAAKKKPSFISRACVCLGAVAMAPVNTAKNTARAFHKWLVWIIRLYMAAHMFLRAFLANPTDAFSAAERVVMQSSMYLVGLLVTVWFYYNKATQCCALLRQEIGCSSNVLEECAYIPAGAGCAVLMGQADLKPTGWYCDAFPDKNNGFHFLTVIAIQIAIMFPVKFSLTHMFTAGGGAVLEPHWRQAMVAAGMNMMEIYAAWCETFFQLFFDPEGALQKPEVQQILVKSKGALMKMLMTCGMTYAMTVVGVFFYWMDRLGIYRKKKKRKAKFESVDVIKESIRSTAEDNVKLRLSNPKKKLDKYDMGDDDDDVELDPEAKTQGVARRKMFTKASAFSGAAAHRDEFTSVMPPNDGSDDGSDASQATGDSAGLDDANIDARETAPVAWYVRSMHAAYKDRSSSADGHGLRGPVDVDDFEAPRLTPPAEQVIGAGEGIDAAPPGTPRASELLASVSMDAERWLMSAVARCTEDSGRLDELAETGDVAECERVASFLSAILDQAAAEAGPRGYGGSREDALRAMALIRASIVSSGGVSACVAVLTIPDRVDGAAPRASPAQVAASAAALALLARITCDYPAGIRELKLDHDGFPAVVATIRINQPRPASRCVADAAAVCVASIVDNPRLARNWHDAGALRVFMRHVNQISSNAAGNEDARERIRADPACHDEITGVLAAFASLKSREREKDKDTDVTVGSVDAFYYDCVRLLPPHAPVFASHVPAAAAALAATRKAFPGTAVECEHALARAGTMHALGNLPLGTLGHKSKMILKDALGDEAMERLLAAGSRDAALSLDSSSLKPEPGPRSRHKANDLDSANQSDGSDHGSVPASPSRALGSPEPSTGGAGRIQRLWRRGAGRDDAAAAPGKPAGEAAMDKVADILEKAKANLAKQADDAKAALAMHTISVQDIERRRRVYVSKLRWSSIFKQNLGWFCAAFLWFFGGYVIIVYGVLIYRFLGPGEEDRYISTWGMAFLINTFGLESVYIVSRKVVFIYVITKFQKSFAKAQESLGWYETYTEMCGMHLLVDVGAISAVDAQNAAEEDEGGDDVEADDGGGD